MTNGKKVVGAVAQLAQEFFDTQANLKKACDAIREAGKKGADIIAFSECFLGQYPYWAHYYGSSAEGFAKTWTALYEGAIQINGEECKRIGKAAREAGIYVVMGCNELSDKAGSETLYNTMLFFDKNGELFGRHRKLMPTYAERLIHGQGDGRDLRVYDTSIGKLGGLICWEHHMTLSKYAMATMGEEIHIASWPGRWRDGDPAKNEKAFEPDYGPQFECDAEHGVREYATETGNFVLSASSYLPADNISDEWKQAIPSLKADWAVGGSSIIAPGGGYLVEPVINEEKILYAELDFNDRRAYKAFFDPIGHYARPDVFNLQLEATNGRELSYSRVTDELQNSSEIDLKEISRRYGIDYEKVIKLYSELS